MIIFPAAVYDAACRKWKRATVVMIGGGRVVQKLCSVWGPRVPTQNPTLLSFFITLRSLIPFSALGFAPNSTQSSCNRIYSSFFLIDLPPFFSSLQLRNQMAKRKKKHKAVVRFLFPSVFKNPESLSQFQFSSC